MASELRTCTHLEVRERRAAPVRSIRGELHFLCPSCSLPLLARYDLRGGARVAARVAERPRAQHVAVSRADAAPARRRPGHAGRRLHAARARAAARRDTGTQAPVHQGRVAQSDELVQGARPVGGGDAGEGARRAHGGSVDGRATPATRPRRTPRPRDYSARCSSRGTPSSRSSTSAALRRRRHARRRAHHRCRAQLAARRARQLGWYDVSTLREPCRVEGKKTMGFELAEQFDWKLPDWIVYPTGGGTGLIGMWKAFDEMEAIGWMPAGHRPRMVSVQADGCAPIIRAFHDGAPKGGPLAGPAYRRRRPARAARDRRLPHARRSCARARARPFQ